MATASGRYSRPLSLPRSSQALKKIEVNHMQSEIILPALIAAASLAQSKEIAENIKVEGSYLVECLDADGNLKWVDTIENLVTTAGKNDLLDKYLAGSAYTAAWYLGLVDGASSPTYAAGDTSASHAGWTENTGYSNGTRPAPSWNAAASSSKATTATAFNINATGTIAGCFLISNSTKGGTTGTLYSCGSFSGGNKSVANSDTLNVTYTASA